MNRIGKCLRLSPADRRLLITSAFLIGIIRSGLWLLPFQTIRRLLATMAQVRPASDEADQKVIDSVCWAVSTVGRHLPVSTCLVQALAAQVLFARHGHQTFLRIGVVKNERGQLEAHAWIEYKEKIIIGNVADLSRYTRLPALPGESL